MNRDAAMSVDEPVAKLAPRRRFQPYSEYRESTIPWQRSIPAHWNDSKLAFLFTRDNAGEVIDKGHWGSGDELLYTCAREPLHSDYPRFPSNKRTVKSDLLLTRNGTPYVHLPEPSSIYSNVVQRITLRRELVREFTAYALGTACLSLKGYGVSIESLNFDMWKLLRLPIPPPEEQRAIAAFLDRETARIDKLIAKKRRLIELLAEKRTALISHAVTKGLNLDAPMKDSGSTLWGRIPHGWSVKELRYLTPDQRRIMYGIVLPGPDVDEGVFIVKGHNCEPGRLASEFLCRTTFEIEASYARSRVKPGDIVYAIRGSIGAAEMVPAELEGANLTQDAARIAPQNDVHGRWLLYVVRSLPFFAKLEAGALGSTVKGINIRDLKRGVLPVPPFNEQQAIATFLDRETARIDDLIARVREAIDKLREYRSALISATVTGKIDVRGEV